MTTQITDYLARTLARLAGPFWGKPRIATVIQAFTKEIQELENVFVAINTVRDLDTADAVRLKVIGNLVGQNAVGQSTEGHRALIRGRIRTNRSSGKTDNILEVSELIGITEFVSVRQSGVASLVVEVVEAVTQEQSFALHYLVPDIRSAGISAVVYTTRTDFTVPGEPADLVFGNANDLVGLPGNSLYHASRS